MAQGLFSEPLSINVLLFGGEVFYLVDDFLILALGLEVETEADNCTGDSSDAASPEGSCKVGFVVQIEFIEEPTKPQDNHWDAE